uniref:Uncharacterized protein n=1 Tax=Romanomermis culicivorax TaxID=13658 RepID=A0A915I945_ROMCU
MINMNAEKQTKTGRQSETGAKVTAKTINVSHVVDKGHQENAATSYHRETTATAVVVERRHLPNCFLEFLLASFIVVNKER